MVDLMERLRAANPEPESPPLPIEEVWRRLDAGKGRGSKLRVPGSRSVGASLPSFGGVMAMFSAVVAIVIAVAAVTLIGDKRTSTVPRSGTRTMQRPKSAAGTDTYSVFSQPPTVSPSPSHAIPARELPHLRANRAVLTSAHLVDLPKGYRGWIMLRTAGRPGSFCIVFVRPGNQPGPFICGDGKPGPDGVVQYGGGTLRKEWNMEGIEPDAAAHVQVRLRNGSTVTVPVVSNMFYATASDVMVSYKVLNARGQTLVDQVLFAPNHPGRSIEDRR